MKVFTAFTFALLILATPLKSENIITGPEAEEIVSGAELVRFADRSQAPAFIRFRPGSEPGLTEASDIVRNALGMGQDDQWLQGRIEKDQLGFSHYRVRQAYQGVEVEGGMYLLHSYQGKVSSVNGEFYPDINLNTTPSISEPQALQTALDYIHADLYQWQIPGMEAFLQQEQNDPFATNYPVGVQVIAPANGKPDAGDFRLTWRFDIYAASPLSRKYVYVDAHTGQVLFERNRLHSSDVQGTAITGYSGTRTITTDSTGPGNYRLRETGRGNGIETYNMNSDTAYLLSVDFIDTDNYWNNVNSDSDHFACDAHWGAEMTYDYFWTTFNRNSLDGNGFPLRSYVHYGNAYNNAFWDGQRATFGDGDGTNRRSFTVLEIVGHEFTHGLINQTADLVYAYEPGALNESFADIFGNVIERYARPNQWSWVVGEDMSPGGFRNMQNPPVHLDPDTYLGTFYSYDPWDNGGVHTNSGIQNKWFYLMTAGETGTNDNGDNYTVTGQGINKAAAIAYRNLSVYLTPNSNHHDARFYAIQSASDLYGHCSAEVIATTNAWYAVGVGDPYVNAVTAEIEVETDLYCGFFGGVDFFNRSSNASSFLWLFGDGDSSTAFHPTHNYLSSGSFEVMLIAYGNACGGNDTAYQTIHVGSDVACPIYLSGNNQMATQTTCFGTIYDSGGPYSPYGWEEETEVTIAPPGAISIRLEFREFDLSWYDRLTIFDGPDRTYPLIGSFFGQSLPNGGTVITTSGAVTLVMATGISAQGNEGFKMDYYCIRPTIPPTTYFSGNNLQSCDGLVHFTDSSTQAPTAWAWDFGDGGTSTLQHPYHTYTNSGTYTVSLISTNANGSDTLVRPAYVNVATTAGPITQDSTRCSPGSVTLMASGTGSLTWYDSLNGGTALGTGPVFTTPPLSSSTTFYVEESSPSQIYRVGPGNQDELGWLNYYGSFGLNYQTLTVHRDLILNSCHVQCIGPGNQTITLWTGTGQFIRDTTFNLTYGAHRFVFDWKLTPGTYRIGGNNLQFYYNQNGADYPYEVGGVMSITGQYTWSSPYHFFYDWEVTTFCESSRTPATAIISNQGVPNVTLDTTGNVSVCQGDSLIVTASGASNYQWSTGSTNPSVTLTQTGTYYVVGWDSAPCPDTSAAIQFSVSPPVTANISSNGPTAFCAGDSVALTASNGASYQWSNGDTTPTIHAFANGTYTVTVANAIGCLGTDSQIVQVWPGPVATISTPSTDICEGDSVLLSASGNGAHTWNTGATGPTLSVDSSGTYLVTVLDSNGCTATASQMITIHPNPIADFSHTVNLPTVNFTNLSTGGLTYFWDFGFGPTSSQTNPSITFPGPGTYNVTLITTSAEGCSDTVVYPVEIVFVGLDQPVDRSLIHAIYPNPFSDAVVFDLNFLVDGEVHISILDALGREVEEVTREWVNAGMGQWKWEAQASLAQGTYVVKIEFDGQVRFGKLVHQR